MAWHGTGQNTQCHIQLYRLTHCAVCTTNGMALTHAWLADVFSCARLIAGSASFLNLLSLTVSMLSALPTAMAPPSLVWGLPLPMSAWPRLPSAVKQTSPKLAVSHLLPSGPQLQPGTLAAYSATGCSTLSLIMVCQGLAEPSAAPVAQPWHGSYPWLHDLI